MRSIVIFSSLWLAIMDITSNDLNDAPARAFASRLPMLDLHLRRHYSPTLRGLCYCAGPEIVA